MSIAHTELRVRGHEGLMLVADAWGDPNAPSVLLLHGGGQTRHAWGNTAEAIAAEGWYALALDLRGHGESEWSPSANYSIDAFVGDVHAVAATLRRPPALVGASLGGITSLVAAGESAGLTGAPAHPFAALVLVDIAVRMEEDGPKRIRSFMLASPEGFASIEEAAAAVAEYLPHRERPRDTSGLERNLRRHEDGRWRWRWDPSFINGPNPPADVANPVRLTGAARALSLPTALIRGQRSDVISEQGAREFLALVPHARYVDVSGAGHMVAGDRNDAFTLAVLGILRELASAAAPAG